ncbi:MAG: flavin reductase family protein [Actinobacteria bacterium]|jgi:flavin reductase (DIM6/NTAB) family NADH-FMN oxidoreductase RutF|nr:flavin reductase family protein [Actinomycetota bacterium]
MRTRGSPPSELEGPLELDPTDWSSRDVYHLMTGLVVPRPIAWVSTVDEDGVCNLAPYSYFNIVASDPPHVVFSSVGEKDTLRNVRSTGECVINIVTMDLVERMVFTATDFPEDEDEFSWAELEQAPSRRVRPPRVAAAAAHLECAVRSIVPVGNGSIVVAEVVHLHASERVWSNGRIDPELLDPVCRLGGSSYASLGHVFKLSWPSWAHDVAGTRPGEVVPRRAL